MFSSEYDAVVVTMPAPQVVQLRGDVRERLAASGWAASLAAVRYSSRYALGLYWGPAEAAAVHAALPFTAWFVPPDDDDVVRYISVDTRMREGGAAAAAGGVAAMGGGPGAAPASANVGVAVVVHTSVSYGAAHVDDSADEVQETVLQRVAKLVPGLPPPAEVKCHRWRYSQVTDKCQLPPGHAGEAPAPSGAALVSSSPPLLLAGDYFTESNLEGCAASAAAALRLLRQCGL
jgi:predicted NAD/FAD-dependent oxidoreductase